MVLDDVLVNFDAQRASAAAEVLAEFSEAGHQLLVFTCHEHVREIFERLGVEIRELPRRESTRRPARLARDRSESRGKKNETAPALSSPDLLPTKADENLDDGPASDDEENGPADDFELPTYDHDPSQMKPTPDNYPKTTKPGRRPRKSATVDRSTEKPSLSGELGEQTSREALDEEELFQQPGPEEPGPEPAARQDQPPPRRPRKRRRRASKTQAKRRRTPRPRTVEPEETEEDQWDDEMEVDAA
jgi:hypothetical protein